MTQTPTSTTKSTITKETMLRMRIQELEQILKSEREKHAADLAEIRETLKRDGYGQAYERSILQTERNNLVASGK